MNLFISYKRCPHLIYIYIYNTITKLFEFNFVINLTAANIRKKLLCQDFFKNFFQSCVNDLQIDYCLYLVNLVCAMLGFRAGVINIPVAFNSYFSFYQ